MNAARLALVVDQRAATAEHGRVGATWPTGSPNLCASHGIATPARGRATGSKARAAIDGDRCHPLDRGGTVATRSIAAGPRDAAGVREQHEALIRDLPYISDERQAKPDDTALTTRLLRRRAPSCAKLASKPPF